MINQCLNLIFTPYIQIIILTIFIMIAINREKPDYIIISDVQLLDQFDPL